MKRALIIISVLFVSYICNAQTMDCKKFKTGKFYYPSLPDYLLEVRSDSIQESYNKGKLIMVWKIKWITDCEYEMTCRKVLVDGPYPIKIGDRLIATIIKTDGDCFTLSLVEYNHENPQGTIIPSSIMCIKKGTYFYVQ